MRHYTFIDCITQGYIVLVGVIILVLHNASVPHWKLLLLIHGVCVVLVHLLVLAHARRPRHPLLGFTRHFYPILLYTGFYRETGALNQLLFTGYIDPFFIRIEQQLFGFQPSLSFMEWLPYVWVSEVFYVSYFSYYLMIFGIGLALFLKGRQQFFHYVSIVSFVFYLCYLTYIFTPVIGPRLFFREIGGYQLPADVMPRTLPAFPEAVQAGLFYKIMAIIYDVFESPGAAFPSSHVAIALCTVCFSFLYLRRIRFVHLVVVVLLCLSTVYCRYHYAVDVVAGAATAAILVPLGNWLYFRLNPSFGGEANGPTAGQGTDTVQSSRS